MNRDQAMRARVADIVELSPTLKRFVLVPAEMELFPAAGAGAHVLLTLAGAERTWRNAYSLVSPPGERRHYEIIVRRTGDSRGGSAFLHAAVGCGSTVVLMPPVNTFPLPKLAGRHVLVAGGIGITPFLSWLPVLRARGVAFELHQFCRPDDAAAFASLIATTDGEAVSIHTRRDALDLRGVLAKQPLSAHLSVCGPAAFMDDVLAQARALGWPDAKLHRESFGAAVHGTPFRVMLARTGLALEVPADRSLLDVLEDAGVDAPYLCRGGACGQCRVRVLQGVPTHHDHVLTPDERARGDAILTCVSRAQTPSLVLDL